MAMTSVQGVQKGAPCRLRRFHEAGVANTQLVATTPTDLGRLLRVTKVLVKYSTDVTKNVVVSFNSGLGAAYDCDLQTIALSAADDGSWIPDGDLFIDPTQGDALTVTVPAGGVGETATVTIDCEQF